ncbi:helix-turn-helix domain-containing protein [Streptomyces sp. NBC_01264]|uniref:AraC-like ligand-binding domain-containing protein n=1 Tax=Streptomyces sp. NBC_01264 TaxID=2903804 RepID=UPI002252E8B0|nr:helix-turn-helix domain-containing protein [Streptomyces sp. NBC_01264]MCX4782386.1 helix-turn-helix domain-containing protein [Streptomyces sp. NBC_01264]
MGLAARFRAAPGGAGGGRRGGGGVRRTGTGLSGPPGPGTGAAGRAAVALADGLGSAAGSGRAVPVRCPARVAVPVPVADLAFAFALLRTHREPVTGTVRYGRATAEFLPLRSTGHVGGRLAAPGLVPAAHGFAGASLRGENRLFGAPRGPQPCADADQLAASLDPVEACGRGRGMWSAVSSGGVPAGERFDWYADIISREVMPAALSSERPAEFRGEAAVVDLGPLRASKFALSPLRSRRTPALIRRGDPEQYQLALLRKGVTSMSQHRNTCTVGGGDLMLWDTSRPSDNVMHEDGGQVRATILMLPRDVLPLRPERLERLLARRIPGDRGIAAILASFMTALEDHAAECEPRELARLGAVAVDLATACLAQHLDAEDRIPSEARAEVLLRRIHAFIEHNLADPELAPPTIAARHNISVRGLHQLFQGQGESVRSRIRRRRLEQCRTDLIRPELAAHRVQSIAARWGFSGPEVFSRSFREAYGLTPTEYRGLGAGGTHRDSVQRPAP